MFAIARVLGAIDGIHFQIEKMKTVFGGLVNEAFEGVPRRFLRAVSAFYEL